MTARTQNQRPEAVCPKISMSTTSPYRVFWREFRTSFRTTGAVLPSSRGLAKALCRELTRRRGRGQRVLEVGPGTGAVTQEIVRRLGPGDHLALVEVNAQFVAHLRRRLATEPLFQSAADQVRLWHESIEQFVPSDPFDVVISGLPLNNFAVDEVERLLGAMRRVMRPGASLSFFEYVAIRRAKALVAPRTDRLRLRGIGRTLGRLCERHGAGRELVWANVPPAWVHHLVFDSADTA
jgi:phospholipid N-methyltransferase